ncbi:MAG TPA: alpha-L-rhamnosidase N-terminal domain-containing protein, partial [Clostridia bacterium]|nr:alpha-L-rhamnosidase N-terminal domain-containing protein [Clostridia bacterium]
MDSIYHARWITTDVEIDDYSTRMFQRKIEFDKKVLKAVFHVTALGIYEAYVNEKQVGKDYRFLPGWTHYSRRVQYQSYDVTKYIK